MHADNEWADVICCTVLSWCTWVDGEGDLGVM